MATEPPKPEPSRNILFKPLGQLDWSAASAEESLLALHEHAIKRGRDAIDWYSRTKRLQRFWARWVRVLAISFAAVGGVLPMISEWSRAGAPPTSAGLSPIWASVALTIAATLVLLDRFFGFSSAWIRFVRTGTHIQTKLEVFELVWEADRAMWAGAPPTPAQVQAAIARCQAFVAELRKAIEDETETWAEEFLRALNDLDKRVKEESDVQLARVKEYLAEQRKLQEAEQTAKLPGWLELEVSNGEQCATGWKVAIGGADKGVRSGKRATFELPPKLYALSVEGEITGKKVRDERVVRIKPGETERLATRLE